MQTPTSLCYFSILRSILLHRRSEKCVGEGSKYAQWIGLYLSFYSDWLLSPFVHGRHQNMRTSKHTFGYGLTLLSWGALENHYNPIYENQYCHFYLHTPTKVALVYWWSNETGCIIIEKLAGGSASLRYSEGDPPIYNLLIFPDMFGHMEHLIELLYTRRLTVYSLQVLYLQRGISLENVDRRL